METIFQDKIKKLEAQRDDLVSRLDLGAARIETARARGKDTSEWENYWIGLLRAYEEVCAQLAALNVSEVQKAQHTIDTHQQKEG